MNPSPLPRPVRRAVLSAVLACGLAVAVAGPAEASVSHRAQGGGPLSWVVVDLSEQHAYLYGTSGAVVARVPVSTGRNGRTPQGTFRVHSRTRVGTAGSDRRVHMDFFTRFRGGVGFHGIPWRSTRANRIATPLGVRPASHGCIRMRDADAAWIYSALPNGAPVTVRA